MTTTPTFWKKEQIFSFNPAISEPHVTALAIDGIVIGFDVGNDIAGFIVDPLASPTSDNLVAALSALSNDPLSGPQFIQQTDGSLIVEFRATLPQTTGGFHDDIYWSLAEPGNVNVVPIENTSADAFLHDATALAGGGTAVVYEFPGDGTPVQVLQFVEANGQKTVSVGVGSQAHAQLNPAIVGLF